MPRVSYELPIAVAIVALGAAAYCVLSGGAVSTPRHSPLSVDQAAARGGLAEMIGTTRASVGFFMDQIRG
jgi:hypothetical protein